MASSRRTREQMPALDLSYPSSGKQMHALLLIERLKREANPPLPPGCEPEGQPAQKSSPGALSPARSCFPKSSSLNSVPPRSPSNHSSPGRSSPLGPGALPSSGAWDALPSPLPGLGSPTAGGIQLGHHRYGGVSGDRNAAQSPGPTSRFRRQSSLAERVPSDNSLAGAPFLVQHRYAASGPNSPTGQHSRGQGPGEAGRAKGRRTRLERVSSGVEAEGHAPLRGDAGLAASNRFPGPGTRLDDGARGSRPSQSLGGLGRLSMTSSAEPLAHLGLPSGPLLSPHLRMRPGRCESIDGSPSCGEAGDLRSASSGGAGAASRGPVSPATSWDSERSPQGVSQGAWAPWPAERCGLPGLGRLALESPGSPASEPWGGSCGGSRRGSLDAGRSPELWGKAELADGEARLGSGRFAPSPGPRSARGGRVQAMSSWEDSWRTASPGARGERVQAVGSWEETSVSGKDEEGASGKGPSKVAQRVYQDLDDKAALAAAIASPRVFGGWNLGKLNKRLGLGDQRKVSTAAVLTEQHRDLRERFELGKIIGRGQFGVIRLVEDKATGEKLACKTISKASLKVRCRDVRWGAPRLLLPGLHASTAPALKAALRLVLDPPVACTSLPAPWRCAAVQGRCGRPEEGACHPEDVAGATPRVPHQGGPGGFGGGYRPGLGGSPGVGTDLAWVGALGFGPSC